MAVRWSRVQLYLSVLTCQGLFATLRERIQYAPAPAGAASAILPGSEDSIKLPRFYDYAGAVHVHSTYSDGIGTVDEIADAANQAGLDFVILCDHASLEAHTNRQDGWHGRTLVVVGTEVTTDAGHLLALNVPDDYLPVTHEPGEAQRRIVDLGGIGFIALPCDLKDHWRDFSLRDSRMGLEVFNLSAIARTKINLPAMALVWSGYRGNKPHKAFHWVAARPDRELRLWDTLICEGRRLQGEGAPYNVVVSIGSIDAHGVMKFAGRAYELPTYAEVFRTLRTHILLLEPLTSGDGASTGPAAQPDLDAVHRA
ncbi:MAG: PHP domain-containing protein, partial [Capsulimonadaceae bacterium]